MNWRVKFKRNSNAVNHIHIFPVRFRDKYMLSRRLCVSSFNQQQNNMPSSFLNDHCSCSTFLRTALYLHFSQSDWSSRKKQIKSPFCFETKPQKHKWFLTFTITSIKTQMLFILPTISLVDNSTVWRGFEKNPFPFIFICQVVIWQQGQEFTLITILQPLEVTSGTLFGAKQCPIMPHLRLSVRKLHEVVAGKIQMQEHFLCKWSSCWLLRLAAMVNWCTCL